MAQHNKDQFLLHRKISKITSLPEVRRSAILQLHHLEHLASLITKQGRQCQKSHPYNSMLWTASDTDHICWQPLTEIGHTNQIKCKDRYDYSSYVPRKRCKRGTGEHSTPTLPNSCFPKPLFLTILKPTLARKEIREEDMEILLSGGDVWGDLKQFLLAQMWYRINIIKSTKTLFLLPLHFTSLCTCASYS